MSKRNISLGLLLLTLGALAVHGYHPYAEDAEIYLPGIKKLLHPALYPSGTEFFESHASLTFFPNLITASVRLTHIPFDYATFLWYLASIFLLLLACWEFGGVCFRSTRSRWGAVALIASLLTLPVAGTALYLMDQYLNPRNLAAFAAVFAATRVLEKKIRARGHLDDLRGCSASLNGVIRGSVLPGSDLFRQSKKAGTGSCSDVPVYKFVCSSHPCLSRGHALSYFALFAAMAVV